MATAATPPIELGSMLFKFEVFFTFLYSITKEDGISLWVEKVNR